MEIVYPYSIINDDILYILFINYINNFCIGKQCKIIYKT